MLFFLSTLWPRFYIMLFVKTLCLKVMKTTMSAAIVCSAVCISDVINNAGIGSKVIKYIMSQPFLLFFGEERTKVAAPWRAQIRSKKVVLLYKEWSPKWSTQMKNVCTFSYMAEWVKASDSHTRSTDMFVIVVVIIFIITTIIIVIRVVCLNNFGSIYLVSDRQISSSSPSWLGG